jgi:hypothetical protein
MAAYVTRTDGTCTEVKNLGWLLRHARECEVITITRYSGESMHQAGSECELCVKLRTDRYFTCRFASFDVCRQWVNRPVLRGLPLRIIGADRRVELWQG